MALKPELAVGGIIIFAGASFFFALAESALFSLGKWRAQQLAERSPGRGSQVMELLGEPQSLLATIVLGNTFANAGVLATALWLALEGAWPIGWTLLSTLALILLGCEVLPKTLAVRAAEEALFAPLLDGLLTMTGVEVYGRPDLEGRTPTVAFNVVGHHPDDVARALAGDRIAVWSGNYYALRLMERLGLEAEGGAVRIGPAHYNTFAEIDVLLAALREIA